MSIKRVSCFFAVACFTTLLVTSGCAKKVSQEDTTRLEEARAAALSAEKKLDQLKQERQGLEDQLANKQTQIGQKTSEKDSTSKQLYAHPHEEAI